MEKIRMTTPLVEMDGDAGAAQPGRHRRPGDHGRGAGQQEVWRVGEVRHHHPQRPADDRVQFARDVEEPQRHHPRRAGRHGVPRAHPHQLHQAGGEELEKAHHHRPPRLRRRVQGHRVPHPRPRQGGAGVHRRRRHRAAPDGVRLRVPGRFAGPVQQGHQYRELRPQLLQLRPFHQTGPVVRHQGHHQQEVRPHVQGHLRRNLRGGV